MQEGGLRGLCQVHKLFKFLCALLFFFILPTSAHVRDSRFKFKISIFKLRQVQVRLGSGEVQEGQSLV